MGVAPACARVSQERIPADEQASPFTNVFTQECARMNALVSHIRRSLLDLDMGLKVRREHRARTAVGRELA